MQVSNIQQNQGKYFCLHSVLTIFMLTVLVVEYNGTLLQEGFYIKQVQSRNKSIIESINLAVRSTKNQQVELISRNDSFTYETSTKLWSKSEGSLMDKIERDQKLLQDHIKEVCLRDGIVKGLNVNQMESRMIIDQKRHFAYCGIGKVIVLHMYSN